MISVHLEFNTIEETAQFWAWYSMGKNFGGAPVGASPVKATSGQAQKIEEPKNVKQVEPEKAAPAPAPAAKVEAAAPAPAPAPVAAPAPAPAAAAVTYDTYVDANGNKLSETIAKLVAKDKNKVVAILTELGVKRGPLLTAEQWPVAMQKFSDALAAAELA